MPSSSTLRNSLGGLVNASADLRIRCVSSVRPTWRLLLALQRSRGSAQGLMTLQKLGKELLAGLLRELHQWLRRKRPASYKTDSTSRLTRTTIVTVLWNFTSAEQTATAGIDQCFPTPGVGSTLARMATTEFGLYSQISNLDVLEVMTSIVVLLKKSPGGMIEKAITVLEKVAAPSFMAL